MENVHDAKRLAIKELAIIFFTTSAITTKFSQMSNLNNFAEKKYVKLKKL